MKLSRAQADMQNSPEGPTDKCHCKPSMPCVPAKLVAPERAPPSRMVREAMHERISERISGPGLGNCGCEGHFATHSILIPSTQWHPLSVIRPRLINELR